MGDEAVRIEAGVAPGEYLPQPLWRHGMTTQELDEKVKSIVMDTLLERFAGEVVFDDVVVEHAVDDFGDGDGSDYLRILIIHDGNHVPLDPSWTSGLIRRIRPKLLEAGIEEFPSPGFIGRAEWKRYHPEAAAS